MNKAALVKGIFIGLNVLGCIGAIGVAGFDIKDNIDELKELKANSLDVTEVPLTEVEGA